MYLEMSLKSIAFIFFLYCDLRMIYFRIPSTFFNYNSLVHFSTLQTVAVHLINYIINADFFLLQFPESTLIDAPRHR